MDEAARKTVLRMIPYGLYALGARNGGDLTLVPTDPGACFKIVLHTPQRPA